MLSLFLSSCVWSQSEYVGRKSEGTLWDQETQQNAIRVLLEEGKLNLVLRLLRNYKEAQPTEKFAVDLEVASTEHKLKLHEVVELYALSHSLTASLCGIYATLNCSG